MALLINALNACLDFTVLEVNKLLTDNALLGMSARKVLQQQLRQETIQNLLLVPRNVLQATFANKEHQCLSLVLLDSINH